MIPGKPWEICSTKDISFVCLSTNPELCNRHKKFTYDFQIDYEHICSPCDSFPAVFDSHTDIYDSANDANTVIQLLITLRTLQKSFLNLMHCCTILEIEHTANPKNSRLFI